MRRRLALAFTLATALQAAAPAQPTPAPPPANIKLALSDCPDLDAATVQALVSLELGDSPAQGDAPSVSAVCAAGMVVIRVDDPVTKKALTRAFDLSRSPDAARSRLLALAIVELIHASWTELTWNPTPQVPAAGPAPAADSRRAAIAAIRKSLDEEPPPRRDFRLLGIGASDLGPGIDTRWGGGLRIGWDGRRLGWSLDVVMQHASRAEEAGTVSIDTVSVDAAVMWRATRSVPYLRIGGGVRAGVAQLVGESAMPFSFSSSQITGPFAGPLGVVSLSVPAGRVVFEATAGGGFLPVAVRASIAGADDAGVADGWIGLRFGMGVLL